jgi:hypothetical protein
MSMKIIIQELVPDSDFISASKERRTRSSPNIIE